MKEKNEINKIKEPACPERFDRKFLKKLLNSFECEEHNHISCCNHIEFDCISDALEKYKDKLEDYFLRATTGDPAYIAYWICLLSNINLDWAKKIIEKVKVGNPARAAVLLAKHCHQQREWAKRVIANATTGDPPMAAFILCNHFNLDYE